MQGTSHLVWPILGLLLTIDNSIPFTMAKWLTVIVYGDLLFSASSVLFFSPDISGPAGLKSVNISSTTRNLISSLISMNKSCPPSSVVYSHTQSCSSSSLMYSLRTFKEGNIPFFNTTNTAHSSNRWHNIMETKQYCTKIQCLIPDDVYTYNTSGILEFLGQGEVLWTGNSKAWGVLTIGILRALPKTSGKM